METIKTDTVGIELTLGNHLAAPYLEAKRLPHVSFIPVVNASSAVIDLKHKRVVWLSTESRLTIDFRCCGGKVKDAIKAYQKCYGEAGPLKVQLVSEGVVLSLQAVTQKKSYFLDWNTGMQVAKNAGWKY